MSDHADAGLREEDLPSLFQAADRGSLAGQRHYLAGTRLRLALVLVAALGSLTSVHFGDVRIDWAALLAAVALCASIITEVVLIQTGPERVWYDGRALAESAKTLAWKYAVGGAPFRIGAGTDADGRADELLSSRLEELLTTARPEAGLLPDGGVQVGERMRALRSAPLDARQRAYVRGRLEGQHAWYLAKAHYHRRRAVLWRVVMLSGEAVGLLFATLRATEVLEVDLAGLAATVVAAAAAWLETRQHSTLSRAYTVTAQELAVVRVRLAAPHSEESWGDAVKDAEDAISREHTMWQASRTA
ncbi:DUF4231 domain-containing protein [Streptomyces viridosporus]|uniref:DUF4231 domain-containing protein n=1 Tax=Streptomyces viridosporus TaxID=67581 RepID=UPI00210041DC|nr:DUF4231 domain-containing protein [Streptomyces viridosporus]